ncbi:MAG: ATP-binding cassette domain-containing protein [Alphaproteobacteria bacterium]|nr:ATP-binding cassette domain-containing protein [Alphaproteobacteria bacterium]
MSASLPLGVTGLRVAFGGRVALDGLSFVLAAGPRTLILGPNGAGKSVLLRVLHGLLAPSAGEITWSRPAIEARAVQAMVFQRPVLLRRSVKANVDYGLDLRGLTRVEIRERTNEVLARTGLDDFADRPARTLSGGEQQRLALARAWALRPEMLFLDEPTANLDPAAAKAVEEIVLAIHAAGTKIVMTTHDLGQARRLGEDVLFLHRGRLIERAEGGRFFQGPATAEASAFLSGDLLW